MKRVLTIAASDCSAASGVQLDLRVFARCGVYGTSAVALLAAQDTYAVRRVFVPAPTIVGAQIDAAFSDLGADACKVGWLRDPGVVGIVAGRIRRHDLRPVVLDPCLWSERGALMTPPATVKRLVRELLPRTTVLTVTRRELGVLAGMPAGSPDEMAKALARIHELGPESVVAEDAPGEGGPVVWVSDAGSSAVVGSAGQGMPFAGAGSVFSAALAAALAGGKAVPEAAAFAAEFLETALTEVQPLGKGLPVWAG